MKTEEVTVKKELLKKDPARSNNYDGFKNKLRSN